MDTKANSGSRGGSARQLAEAFYGVTLQAAGRIGVRGDAS